jgi:hypothetical protein
LVSVAGEEVGKGAAGRNEELRASAVPNLGARARLPSGIALDLSRCFISDVLGALREGGC